MNIVPHLQKINNRITNLVKTAEITLPDNDLGNYPTAQVSYYGKIVETQMVYPYGLHANAPANTLLKLTNNMGQEENTYGIPYSTNQRPKGLQVGEVVVGSPQVGNYTKFCVNGDVNVTAIKDVNIVSPGVVSIKAKGSDLIEFTDEVKFKHCTTGSGTASMWTNCPAIDTTKPYTWIKVMASDGSVCYMPAWK